MSVRRMFLVVFSLSLGLLLQAAPDQMAPNVVTAAAKMPGDEQKAFKLPPGFDIELVAAEPDIFKPMNLAFDARSRLWVTDTLEYPFPVGPGKKGRDSVKVLDDFAPDGRARKITTFTDGLNIPIGLLPLWDGTMVFSIPAILKLSDTDGDGKADQHPILYQEYGTRDTHGMTNAFTWGFDGWIYACHGYANTSTVKAGDGSSATMNSGNTYRMKADGSRIEQFTWGQVNPFGLTFDPLGNLYSADCHSQPLYQLLRGGYYPSFGKPHDGLGFAPDTITNYNGSTAVCGLAHYAADHFPEKYRDCVFVGDVMTNRINLFRLEWHGSSPRAIQEEFLSTSDQWFRPVDIKLGPDGALYIADFYNCIIGHYEVPLNHPARDRHRGRIWRIVYKGEDGKSTPTAPRRDWMKADVKDLVTDLGHANLTVRTFATNELVKRSSKEAIEAVRGIVKPTSNRWQRAHGLWVLERSQALDDETLSLAAKDEEKAVRVHAQHVLSERARLTKGQRDLAIAALKDRDPNVQRAAADALGRHPSAENVPPLLVLRHAVPADDSHLLHVVRMALRNQLWEEREWLPEQLGLKEARDHAAIADVAQGVPSVPAARFLLAHISDNKGAPGSERIRHIARYGNPQIVEAIVAFARSNTSASLELRGEWVHAFERGTAERGGKLSEPAREWAALVVNELLASANPGNVQKGIELVGVLKAPALQDGVVKLLRSGQGTEGQRLAAVNSLTSINPTGHAPLLGDLLRSDRETIKVREQCAVLLGRMNVPGAYGQMVQALQAAPAQLQTTIALNLAATLGGGEALLKAVAEGKASARLLQDRGVELKLIDARIPKLKDRLAILTAGLGPVEQRVLELIRARRDGFRASRIDITAGHKVFEKGCAICHQIAGKGSKIGPQLDGIGLRGLERLLEDTLDPNRNVDQAFRTTKLELKNGQLVSGLLLRTDGEILVLADNQGKEIRVPRKDVADQGTSQISPMPSNFAEQLSKEDFYNLMAYLLEQKPKGN